MNHQEEQIAHALHVIGPANLRKTAPRELFGGKFTNSPGTGDPPGDDPMPFGLTEKNREIVATLWRYLLEQKLISRIPDVDTLFVDGATHFVDA